MTNDVCFQPSKGEETPIVSMADVREGDTIPRCIRECHQPARRLIAFNQREARLVVASLWAPNTRRLRVIIAN